MKDSDKENIASVDDTSSETTEKKTTQKIKDGRQKKSGKENKTPSLPELIRDGSDSAIKSGLKQSMSEIFKKYDDQFADYCHLSIIDPSSSIGAYDLDKIYSALLELNTNREKDVLLLLLSPGGAIEPAYQISKLCKSFSKEKFVVVVPRHAKSAATLIAIGADEIHMSPLGQLGPIDPQLGGLPALGVARALERIASLSQMFPGSSEMFAHYLRMALTVEQIGYCERISESAEQYAERLLQTKPHLVTKAPKIAKELVYEYKHHGFVIDIEEARLHLGDNWIKSETPEIAFAEEVYKLFDQVNLIFDILGKSKRLLILGKTNDDFLILEKKN